jgi:hypothetical protein
MFSESPAGAPALAEAVCGRTTPRVAAKISPSAAVPNNIRDGVPIRRTPNASVLMSHFIGFLAATGDFMSMGY